jgi:HSP20 family protein
MNNDLMSLFDDFGWTFSDRRPWDQFAARCDIDEDDNHYVLSFDLPGVRKEDVKIELHDDVLTITGERKWDGRGNRRFSERGYGRFQRSFSLPSTVDAGKVDAEFVDGVLRVSLPKAERAKPRQIEIRTEARAGELAHDEKRKGAA